MAAAVNGVSFTIPSGGALGLVGESGSGKTVTCHAIMRLIEPPGRILDGAILFGGHDLLRMPEREIRKIRGGQISIVFQDPSTSLNPAFTVGRQIIDVIMVHQAVGRRAAREKAVEVLKLVGIPWPELRLENYPHEFSGGMRQRALLAMAIACQPRLLIADEPTTALDVTIQAQIVALLRQLRQELGLTVLFVTHNLDLMAEICERAVVLYGGAVMEEASVDDLFTRPRHPYTRLSTSCGVLESIEGAPPVLGSPVLGCPFHPRCPEKMDICRQRPPEEIRIDDHRVACWMAGGR
jgi:oligopeptide/dipeptide ABC transporter ATP-binding protein